MIMNRTNPRSLSALARIMLSLVVLGVLVFSPTLAARSAGSLDPEFTGEEISLVLDRAELSDLLRTFSDLLDLQFVVDPRAQEAGLLDTTVSLDVTNQPWDEVLHNVITDNGLGYTLEGNFVWLHPLGALMEGDRAFTGEEISLTLSGADLRHVLGQFAMVSGFEIVVPPSIQGQVDADFQDVPWDQALDLILRVSGLGYSLDGKVINVFRVTESRGQMLLSPAGKDQRIVVSESADGSDVFRFVVGGPIAEPMKLHTPAPVYPADLKQAGVSGKVLLQLVINADGQVETINPLNRSVDQALIQAAATAVKQWTFAPATLDGRPVAVEYILTVNFELDDK